MTPLNGGGANGNGKPRVLIVDDEPDVETLVRQRFKRRAAEFEFDFARNGREALEKISGDPSLAVVVTDINMPEMDGLALLNQLNRLDGRVVKTVILSAYGDMQNIRSAMNLGAFDFLTKPIDFEDFESTLRRTGQALNATREGIEARERLTALEQELDIAAQIQASMLPREFEPGRKDFGIFAAMHPARRVGGDFYDFFLIDEKRLGFAIGDVSGKGIPAALFMAVSRTLLRATALQGIEPGKCLQYANQVLRGQREGGVYVTAFYAILHTDTGLLEYALGGHNPPYRVSATGEIEEIAEPAGMVIGLLPDGYGTPYETGRLQLNANDLILLYTDGVTEAQNEAQKFFGEKRLRTALKELAGQAPQTIVEQILESVETFVAGAAQSDDITVLGVKWTPGA